MEKFASDPDIAKLCKEPTVSFDKVLEEMGLSYEDLRD